ncbi:MAG: glycosyltransferase family 4 protein [Candidatus Micrarchaeota archaeon]|nr:glycosyltransferase family 4 protein [Candidatus Micrarchaeota archaeon]
MNIAYFVWEYPPRLIGGLGTYAAEITKQYAAMGHKLTVFTMNSDGKLRTRERMGSISVFRPKSIRMKSLVPLMIDEEIRRWGDGGVDFFGDVFSYNFLSADIFCKALKPGDFDIAVCHDWLSAMAGITVKDNTDLPLAFHVHSTEYGRSGGKGSPLIKNIEYSTGQKADMVFTVSYSMEEELRSLGFQEKKVRVVWNGVDEKKYNIRNFKPDALLEYRRKMGVRDDEKMVLFTGRLTFVKGVDTLVRAMPSVIASVPKAKLVVLGRGEMSGEIRAMVQQLGIASKVILIDKWVDEDERLLLYASCDLVCAPSRYEPFGIVPLEGMGMAKPVVVGVGGLREIVLDGTTGLYCDPNSPESIAGQLTAILSDDSLARKMGLAGRRRVEKVYTWKKIAKDTVSLYDTIVK